jgi:hypothetical protein
MNPFSLAPPPPPLRHRASSTANSNLRPPLTIKTLGRRRSSSLSYSSPEESSPPADTPVQIDDSPPPSPSMLFIVASRILQLLHVQPKHFSSWSDPSSPRSSTDEFVLPLSAPSTPTSFTHAFPEKPSLKPQQWWPSSVRFPFYFLA